MASCSSSGMVSMTWAEDRATRGRDPSADSGAKDRRSEGIQPSTALYLIFQNFLLRDWHQRDKSQGVWGTESPKVFLTQPPTSHLSHCERHDQVFYTPATDEIALDCTIQTIPEVLSSILNPF